MAVRLAPPEQLLPVPGIRLGVAEAAIKRPGQPDLLVVALNKGARVAGVFTRNAFSAAPIILCRERIDGSVRGLLFNAGNANAATGQAGLTDARITTGEVASVLGLEPESVLPFSTGVIGVRLPVRRILAAIPRAVANLREDGWNDGAKAIMTTDTVPKGVSQRVRLSCGADITVTGIAKGVGMICPDMATMLAFVATDARLTPAAARRCLKDAVGVSFNSITVDGDTSTNDACVMAATALTGRQEIHQHHVDYPMLSEVVRSVCLQLAQAMVRDGEGATKFICVAVEGARTRAEARRVAYSIAHSPLVKTALFASDANWGRVAMAIGKSGVRGLNPACVDIAFDEVPLMVGGQLHPDYRDEMGSAVVRKAEFTIRVRLGRGAAQARLWTCDLSYDYVRINGEYRT